MPFEFERTSIAEVILIKPKVFKDDRGFFMETYKKSDFAKAGIDCEFVQDNHSQSSYGVLRGLHFQKEPFAQAKLVRAVEGEIFDVAVDIRKGSPSYGIYVSVILSEENRHMLFIPRGFAHGFYVQSQRAKVHYKADNEYNSNAESGIVWNDPELGIQWPSHSPSLSLKDAKWSSLKSYSDTMRTR